MITLLISNSDLFDEMYQEINRQNTFYFWIIGIVLTISVAIAGFFGVLQWRLSDKQIQRMKEETKNEIVKEYSLEKVAKIDGLDEYQQKAKVILSTLNINRQSELIEEIFGLIHELGNSSKIDSFFKMVKFEQCINELIEDPFIPKDGIGSMLTAFLTELNRSNFKQPEKVKEMSNYIQEKGAEALQEFNNIKNT